MSSSCEPKTVRNVGFFGTKTLHNFEENKMLVHAMRPATILLLAFGLFYGTVLTGSAQGQSQAPTPAKAATPAKAPAASTAAKAKDVPPKPKDVMFDTSDGVRIHATFYPGMKEKESVPVLLVHDLNSNRKSFHDLALFLQTQGCAVLVPDLRGHGESIRAEGVRNVINPDRMTSQQFQAISGPQGDMERCKRFLMDKNNAGELNIEKLCVVGAGFGAIVAADWAALDWSWPPLAIGKQGQDVKALVLISPVWSARGLQIQPATASPAFRSVISTMIVIGEQDKKSLQCADRLAKIIERFNPNATAEDVQNRTFFYLKLDTSLTGMKMLDEASLQLPQRIAQFIELRLTNQTFPWQDRKKAF